MPRHFTRFVTVLVCLLGFVHLGYAQSYTLSQLTQNNTAACSKDNYGLLRTAYCAEEFPGDSWALSGGWADDEWVFSNGNPQNPAPIITTYHDPSPAGTYNGTSWNQIWNISKGPSTPGPLEIPPTPNRSDMHSLMYGNGLGTLLTTVIVELQSWFCDPNAPADPGYTSCNAYANWVPPDQNPANQTVSENYGHADVGYTTWNRPTMDARTVDIWDSGGNAVVMDWAGGQNDCPTAATNNNPSYSLSSYVNTCGSYQYFDQSYQDMVNSIQVTLPSLRSGANMKFFLILDRAAWVFSSVCGANSVVGYDGHDEPWCALNKMIADLNYALTGQNEGGQGSFIPYLKQTNYFTVGGLPVIALFQNEYNGGDFSQCNTLTCRYDDTGDTCTSGAACYSDVYQMLRAWLDNTSGLGANKYYLIFAYESGCPGGSESHLYSDGCYEWIKPHGNSSNPGNVTVNNQRYDDPTAGNTSPKAAADNFYSNSLNLSTGTNGQSPLVIGAAYKGFDDYMATWWSDRILSQECGQTWLYSWEEMAWDPVNQVYGGPDAYYSPTHPLKYMMVETWDDYEEGSEIETGISNCVTDSTFLLTLSNPTLSWAYSFNDTYGFANVDTVDHYVLYYSTDGTNYSVKDNNITNTGAGCSQSGTQVSCTGINLNNYSWQRHTSFTLYVQAAGKAAMTNHLSDSVTYTTQ